MSPLDAEDLLEAIEADYADSVALESQPEWIDDLRNAHERIETAFVRVRGPVPFPRIELEIRNQVSDETGWHRLELVDGGWNYAYADPPAGVVAAEDWPESHVDADSFERWWNEHA